MNFHDNAPSDNASPYPGSATLDEGTAADREAMVSPRDIEEILTLIYGGAALSGVIPVFHVHDEEGRGLMDLGQGRKMRAKTDWYPDLPNAIKGVQKAAGQYAIEERGGDHRLAHAAVCGSTFGDIKSGAKGNWPGHREASIANIRQLRAFAIDHDTAPSTSRPKLVAKFRPTCSTVSGGVTIEGGEKGHDWYVFDPPLETPQEIEEARRMQKRLVEWCGSGDSSMTPVHPLRCPGGLHRKRKGLPRASRLTELRGEKWTLAKMRGLLDEVAPEAPKPERKRRPASEKEDDRLLLRQNIRDGHEVHASITKLAMSMAHIGFTAEEIAAEIEGLMTEAEHGWGATDRERWKDRSGDIGRAVATAMSKVEESDAFLNVEARRERISIMRDPQRVKVLHSKVNERIAALKPDDVANGDVSNLDTLFEDIGTLRLEDLAQKAMATTIADNINKKWVRGITKKIKKVTATAWRIFKEANAPQDTDQRPVIVIHNTDHDDMISTCWKAIGEANALERPIIYRSIGGLSRVKMDLKNAPAIEAMNAVELANEMKRLTRWKRSLSGSEIGPLPEIMRDMLAERVFPVEVPVLSGFIDTPRFSPDGELLTTPGYHPGLGMIYLPGPGFVVRLVSDVPSAEDVARALALLLDEALEGFPFRDPYDETDAAAEERRAALSRLEVDNETKLSPAARRKLYGRSSRAHALALILLPFVRPMISGPTPFHLINKAQPRAGGGYLGAVFTRIAFGAEPQWQQEIKKDPEELRKRITALVASNVPAFMLDNVENMIGGGVFASALTTTDWLDRALGSSNLIAGEIAWTWVGVGNNTTVSAEMADRTLMIRINPGVANPELRKDFKHTDLSGWCYRNRGELVWSCLTLIQHWIAQGKYRDPEIVLGGFDDWARVMNGILSAAGVKGFLENREAYKVDHSSSEHVELTHLLEAWFAEYGERWTRVGDPHAPLDRELGERKGGLLALIDKHNIDFADIDAEKEKSVKALRSALKAALMKHIDATYEIDMPKLSGGNPGPGRISVTLKTRHDGHEKQQVFRLIGAIPDDPGR